MGSPTISLQSLREAGVTFTPLPGWLTLRDIAARLAISYPGATYLVLDAQVFDFGTEVRMVGERTLVVKEAAFERYQRDRESEPAKTG